jgi:hypothetical protein
MLLLGMPLQRRPDRRKIHTESHSQFRKGFHHVAERTTKAVSCCHVESCCQRGLVGCLRVAPPSNHPLLQLLLGSSGGFWIGMRLGIVFDPASTAKRFDSGQEPSLEFPMGQHHGTGNGICLGSCPSKDLRSFFPRATLVAVEQDQNTSAVFLCSSQLYGCSQLTLIHELGAWLTNGWVDIQFVDTGFISKSADQHRYGSDFSVSFDDETGCSCQSLLEEIRLGNVFGRDWLAPKGIRAQQLACRLKMLLQGLPRSAGNGG